MNQEVRKALPDDLPAIQEIARRTISGTYRSFLGDANVDLFLDSGGSDEYVSDHLDNCWVLLAANRIAGFCVCRSNLIDLMMIDIDLHRRGLGTRLLRHCEQHLFEQFDQITLESFEGNSVANAFYRKNGWASAGAKLDGDTGTTKLVFTKHR